MRAEGRKDGKTEDPITQLRTALADRYAIERELGRGGMATVYLAHDSRHDRPVALKVLHPDLASTLGPDRFQREIRLAARLQHPHILGVHDSGESAGFLWFTMPYVEGESLRSRLDREHQLPLDDAIRIAREAADALEYAHQHGIVHRDIKPENILLSSGHALVADFGVARAVSETQAGLTGTGLVVGTAAYMSPEQASGERQLDGRTDVYALGCVLYEMLAGEAPFTGPTAQAVLSRALTDSPKPLRGVRQTIPSALDMVVAKAMAKLPADRYATAAEFGRALQAAGRAELETVGRSDGRTVGVPAERRSRVPLAGVLGIGFLIGAGALFAWRTWGNGGGAPADGGAKVIAVLPFVNQGAAEDEYFADGLTDEIRGKLAGITGLQVIASGSADQYKKSDKAPSQIAQELGATYLLTGRVRWEKGGQSRVRVSPELILISRNRTPTTVWQQPFDASLTDVFQVQADIASRVAQALDVALGANERRELGERPTSNLAAYDAYLKAEQTNALAGGDPVNIRRAIQYYEQAVALDSTFAVAYARLAWAQTLLYSNSVPDPRLAEAARRSAERAVELAPDRPEPANAMGRYHSVFTREDKAQEVFAEALRKWPNDADLLAGVATSEMSLGRWEDALRHFGHALAVDPRSVDNARRYARALLFLRRYDEALPAADRAIALAPMAIQLHQTKAMIFLARGDLEGARRVIRQIPGEVDLTTRVAYMGNYWDLFWVLEDADQELVLRLPPSAFDENRAAWAIVLTQTYALRGDRARARAYADTARMGFERQVAENPGDAQSHAFVGLSNAYLGRKKEAIQAGERAVEITSIEQDGFVGPYWAHLLARTYTMVGEHDKAVAILERLLQVPYFLSPAWLRIDPAFEPLRTHPRFRQLTQG